MKNKRILIIVPHEDDEIHLAGSFIYTYHKFNDIKVVYTTNGDYNFNANIRYSEAINSLKILGIAKKDIIFLGYCDQPYDGETHMYNNNSDWTAKKGFTETYGALGIDEYCYMKTGVHKRLNKDNLEMDLENLISTWKPDIIICNDLDFHPDHIMTSLLTEKAIGNVIKAKKDYVPIVFKGFTYENSYHGPKDFFSNKNNMFFNLINNEILTSNKYYNIKEAVKIEVNPVCGDKNLFINPIYKAIVCHKSQLLVSRTERIINDDLVYWKRNTNNLLLNNNCKIEVSSGEKKYLNDFLLCDSSYILNGNINEIKYDKGIWIPSNSDKKKEINIILAKREYVSSIIFYSGLINNKGIKRIDISFDDGSMQEILLKNKYKNILKVNKELEKIQIIIKDKILTNGFSEIEIISQDKEDLFNNLNNSFIKKESSNYLKLYYKFILDITIYIQRIKNKLFLHYKNNTKRKE